MRRWYTGDLRRCRGTAVDTHALQIRLSAGPSVYSSGMYSIVLVDDHAIVREGFKRLIELEPDLDVVAECRSADDAVEAVSHWRPDLVALDLSLPDGSGLPLIEHLLSVSGQTRIVVLS